MPTIDVYCPTCRTLDSRWLVRGKALSSLCCVECGDALTTPRANSAKQQLLDGIWRRAAYLARQAAAGAEPVELAYDYARYAAHTAFKARLVGREPEAKR